ncbi:NADH-quinone oxidoreductase subunit G [Limibaculum sp. M0105]|uniref:NADH-quinone oxidoreductase subunit G n=1 Tax=Thermohalobaculum xanthum TaxID=2753746 RepID=A0A8J7M3R9_9RHOB|nr:molybdopterin-dependent oxidoreductase [Thermohalobaculum xanthum]MBK0397781.1 NADH-quinone oxidoreductase subunit G [Thermohalobaculum xanthum]
MSELRKIIIDDREVEVDPRLTLLQACEEAGVEIPRFCYHERLSIAGNCRMCLVEVVGGPPKPAASCAMQVKDLRPGPEGAPPVIRTNTPMVKKAREGVMEFLLINHPLDCPICDQGGECDLQDQAMAYGVDFSRFREPKRSATDLALGPLVETHMTRCISCTRCVRFMTEVAGVPEMGQVGRGEDSEITSYETATLGTEMGASGPDLVVATLKAGLSSELQGNIVDLCPVGALTNKPYAFTARPWELRKFQSIDVMDALGSNTRVDVRGREVMRILPRNHDGVNEEWLADRSRYVWDGLRRQRLDRPYVRRNGKLKPASWSEAFAAIAASVKAAGGDIAAVAGDLVSVEPLWALKKLVNALGSERHDCRQDGARLVPGNRSAYVGNAAVADIDGSDAILVVGSNPRDEAPVLNARIRKAWLAGAEVAVIGEPVDLSFETHHLGSGPDALTGESRRKIVDYMKGRNAPLIVLGQGALARDDGAAILGHVMALADEVGAKLLILHTAAARVGAMDVGFTHPGGVAGALEGAKVIFNLGADEIEIADGPFVIYQGHHGDRGAHRADVILPGAAWTEQPGTYVNTEGRVQIANRAGFPPGDAREDWAILRALSAELGATLPFDTLDALRRDLYAAHPHFAAVDTIAPSAWQPVEAGKIAARPFRNPISDHFLTNPVTRASEVMAECSRLAAERRSKALAAE